MYISVDLAKGESHSSVVYLFRDGVAITIKDLTDSELSDFEFCITSGIEKM